VQAPLLLRVMDRDWLAKDDALGDLSVDLMALTQSSALVFESRPLLHVETGALSFHVRWHRAAKSGSAPSIWDPSLPSGATVGADDVVRLPPEITESASSEETRAWEVRTVLTELQTVIREACGGGLMHGRLRRKETRVLTLSSQAVRLLNGGRMISCKSGKDRTGMSVTADQVSVLARWHHLPAADAHRLLNEMRRDGCRMENTRKNVGKRGYAFNAFQRLLLPASLRAPSDTTVAGLQS